MKDTYTIEEVKEMLRIMYEYAYNCGYDELSLAGVDWSEEELNEFKDHDEQTFKKLVDKIKIDPWG